MEGVEIMRMNSCKIDASSNDPKYIKMDVKAKFPRKSHAEDYNFWFIQFVT